MIIRGFWLRNVWEAWWEANVDDDAKDIEGTLTNHHHIERFSTVMIPVSQSLPCWDSTIHHLVI